MRCTREGAASPDELAGMHMGRLNKTRVQMASESQQSVLRTELSQPLSCNRVGIVVHVLEPSERLLNRR